MKDTIMKAIPIIFLVLIVAGLVFNPTFNEVPTEKSTKEFQTDAGATPHELNDYLWEYFSYNNITKGDTSHEGLNGKIRFNNLDWTVGNVVSGSEGNAVYLAGNDSDHDTLLEMEYNYEIFDNLNTFFDRPDWAICSMIRVVNNSLGSTVMNYQPDIQLSYGYYSNGNFSDPYFIPREIGGTQHFIGHKGYHIPADEWHMICYGWNNSATGFMYYFGPDAPEGYLVEEETSADGGFQSDSPYECGWGILGSGCWFGGPEGYVDDTYYLYNRSFDVFKKLYNGTWHGTDAGVGLTPTLSSTAATNVGSNTATIGFSTDLYTTHNISYVPAAGGTVTTITDGTLTKSHSEDITGLDPETTYNYTVLGCNPNNLCAEETLQFNTTEYQFDVVNVTMDWRRYTDTPTTPTIITSYVLPDNTATTDVMVTTMVNGTIICENATTFSSGTGQYINCEYTPNNNIGLIRVYTNYTLSSEGRMIGIWKDHPFFHGVDNWTALKNELENADAGVSGRFNSWKTSSCNDIKDYSIAPTGYWRGNLFEDFGLCYWLHDQDTQYLTQAQIGFDYWCGVDKSTWDAWSVHDTVALMGRMAVTYDLLAPIMNQSYRDDISACIYKLGNWSLTSSERYSFSPDNGQGIEAGRSETIITYGEDNTYGDPFLQNNEYFDWYLDSSYNFLAGYRGGIIAPDGQNYRTYGMYSGYIGTFLSLIEYPNGEFIDAFQETICDWSLYNLYNIVKTDTYSGDSARRLDDRDSNAYSSHPSPNEAMMGVRFCNNATKKSLNLWMFDFFWDKTDNYPLNSVQHARDWMAMYENVTPESPADQNLPLYYQDKTENGTLPGIFFWRSGWDTLEGATTEDTVISYIADDGGTNGHYHADDQQITLYVGGPDGGEEIFTDGGGRRGEYLGSTYLGRGQDYKAAEVRHNTLFIDDKYGGAWGDGGVWEPGTGYQLLERSNYNSVTMNTCWFEFNESLGGLETGLPTNYPECGGYYPANFSPRWAYSTLADDNSLIWRTSKFYYGGSSGEYVNWSREGIIFNNSERMFILLFDRVDNPTATDHNYSTNWLSATPNTQTTGNITTEGAGYKFSHGVARSYFEVIDANVGFSYDINVETLNKGEYQVGDSYYERVTENHVDFASTNDLEAITWIVPYTEAQSQPLQLYGVDDDGTTLRVRILGATTTYEVNFTKDNSLPISYATYETTVPFVQQNSPVEGDFKASSTVNFNCSISSSNTNVQNLTLVIDGVDNSTYIFIGGGSSEENVFSVSGLSDGEHTYTCYGYDTLGVVSNTPAVITFTVDTVYPATTINAPATNDIKPLVNLSVSETVATLSYSMNGVDYTQLCADCSSDASTYLYLGEGNYNLYARSVDYAGNTNISLLSYTLDLNNNYTDEFSSTLYDGTHEYTETTGGALQFFKLPVQEYLFSTVVGSTECVVVNINDADYTLTDSAGSWPYGNFINTTYQNTSLHTRNTCNTPYYRLDTSSASCPTYNAYNMSDYPKIEFYVQVDSAEDYTPFGSLTYNELRSYYDYQWTAWWAVDDVPTQIAFHGSSGWVDYRYTYTTPDQTELTKKRTVKFTYYPRCSGTAIDQILVCRGITSGSQGDLVDGGCYPTSSKTASTIATGNYTSIQVNTSSSVDNITVSWSAAGATNYSFEVSANGGTNWHIVPSSGSKVDVTDGSQVMYRVFFEEDETVNITNVQLIFDGEEIADTTAPTISNLAASSVNSSGATIGWQTDENANYTLGIWEGSTLNVTYNQASPSASPFSVQSYSLAANTTYSVNLTVCDASANCGTNNTLQFTTNETPSTPSNLTLSTSFGSGISYIAWRVLFLTNTYAYNQTPTGQNDTNALYYVGASGSGCLNLQIKSDQLYPSVDTEVSFNESFTSYVNVTDSYQTIGQICDGDNKGVWFRRQYYSIPSTKKALSYSFQVT